MNEKQKSISEIIEEVKEEMCDRYCKYAENWLNRDEFPKECDDCPMSKL